MTQKELLYLEDAIGHEKSIMTICNESVKLLQDESLKTFLQGEAEKHKQAHNRLLRLMEEKANEWSNFNWESVINV